MNHDVEPMEQHYSTFLIPPWLFGGNPSLQMVVERSSL